MSTAIEESAEQPQPTANKWVYLFEEGSGDDKSLLGGKGAGLCEMTRAGLPGGADSSAQRSRIVDRLPVAEPAVLLEIGQR